MASFVKGLLDSKERANIMTKAANGNISITSDSNSSHALEPGDAFDLNGLPEELLVYTLTWVPAVDLVKHCSLVSKHWLEVSRDSSLWRVKCERDGIYVPGMMRPPPDDFRMYYFKNPYKRNLLQNPLALEGMNYWIKPGGMTRPEVEDSPYGADAIATHIPVTGPVKNWVTSFRFGSMSQSVNLIKEGCSEQVLDQMRPSICTSVWCAARWDCGSKFIFTVQLLDADNKELDKFEEEMDLSGDQLRRKWHKIEHTFSNYKPGLRHVLVQMGGKDTQFWAGNYGSKFTCPSLGFSFCKK